jgi:hypothetical protein
MIVDIYGTVMNMCGVKTFQNSQRTYIFQVKNNKIHEKNVWILFIKPLIKVNLWQLIKMLNGNEENEYRHRPEYMEFVVIYNV